MYSAACKCHIILVFLCFHKMMICNEVSLGFNFLLLSVKMTQNYYLFIILIILTCNKYLYSFPPNVSCILLVLRVALKVSLQLNSELVSLQVKQTELETHTGLNPLASNQARTSSGDES